MFEEVAVWAKVDATCAVRYVGFRSLETGKVWIALRNWVALDDNSDLRADELGAPAATLEAFLNDLPSDDRLWSPSTAEAVVVFIEQHPELLADVPANDT